MSLVFLLSLKSAFEPSSGREVWQSSIWKGGAWRQELNLWNLLLRHSPSFGYCLLGKEWGIVTRQIFSKQFEHPGSHQLVEKILVPQRVIQNRVSHPLLQGLHKETGLSGWLCADCVVVWSSSQKHWKREGLMIIALPVKHWGSFSVLA